MDRGPASQRPGDGLFDGRPGSGRAKGAGGEGVPARGAVRLRGIPIPGTKRRDAGVIRGYVRIPKTSQPALRREPASDCVSSRRPALFGRRSQGTTASGEGALVQQHPGRRRGLAGGNGFRFAGCSGHQAQQPVRARGPRRPGHRLPARPRGGSGVGVRRHRRLQQARIGCDRRGDEGNLLRGGRGARLRRGGDGALREQEEPEGPRGRTGGTSRPIWTSGRSAAGRSSSRQTRSRTTRPRGGS